MAISAETIVEQKRIVYRVLSDGSAVWERVVELGVGERHGAGGHSGLPPGSRTEWLLAWPGSAARRGFENL
jgi:hypothetical protein